MDVIWRCIRVLMERYVKKCVRYSYHTRTRQHTFVKRLHIGDTVAVDCKYMMFAIAFIIESWRQCGFTVIYKCFPICICINRV